MKRIILAVVAVFVSSATLAADPAMYVSASAGRAEQKLSVDDFGSGSDNDTGFQGAFGYRFTPNFGVEAGYANFGKGSGSDGGFTASAKPESFYAAMTGTFNITPAFALTSKFGVARSSTKIAITDGFESESVKLKNTTPIFGIGASYAVAPNVAVIAEYQHFGKVADENGFDLKAELVSVGVRFSF